MIHNKIIKEKILLMCVFKVSINKLFLKKLNKKITNFLNNFFNFLKYLKK